MSGSGSTCFAVTENLNEMKQLLKIVRNYNTNNWFMWYGKKKEFGFKRILY